MEHQQMVLVEGRVVATTVKAVLLDHEMHIDGIWIPRSVIENGEQVMEGEDALWVAEWFARRNDLMIQ